MWINVCYKGRVIFFLFIIHEEKETVNPQTGDLKADTGMWPGLEQQKKKNLFLVIIFQFSEECHFHVNFKVNEFYVSLILFIVVIYIPSAKRTSLVCTVFF
jgi:hypothetical protein